MGSYHSRKKKKEQYLTCAINQDLETGIYMRRDPVVPIKQPNGVGFAPRWLDSPVLQQSTVHNLTTHTVSL